MLLAAVSEIALLMHAKRSEDGRSCSPALAHQALAVVALFGMLFPYVMPNINGGEPALTTTNASSLTIMTWVAVVFVPIVLAYWSSASASPPTTSSTRRRASWTTSA